MRWWRRRLPFSTCEQSRRIVTNSPIRRARALVEVLVKIAIILAIGLAAEWASARLLARPRTLLDARVITSYWMRLPLAVVRLLLRGAGRSWVLRACLWVLR